MESCSQESRPTLYGAPDWRFAHHPQISSTMRAWAVTAIILGGLTVIVALAAMRFAGYAGDLSLAHIDMLETAAAVLFVAGGVMTLAGQNAGLRLLVAISGAACLMNAFDLVRDLRAENIALQLIASAYCLALASAARHEEIHRI